MSHPKTENESPPQDLHNNLLTSSDFHEVKDMDLIQEDEPEYKEYKYR